jgi:Tol biopolymer transport system component/subtilase family serine protease/flagellar hook assembly protein FlgD/prenyltransferase beta subunit
MKPSGEAFSAVTVFFASLFAERRAIMRALFQLFAGCRHFRKGLIPIIYTLLLALPSHADDFSVKNIGDYGNVTVMEVTGNYDENNPDGTPNALPRRMIAREFFKTHKDEYDTIVIFTGFDFKMSDRKEVAFYTPVKNDIRGIGQEIFDNSPSYGSNGKLQGTIDMGNIATLGTKSFEFTLDTLAHEMLHRWSAYVRFKDGEGNLSTALLGEGQAHWSYLLDSMGSIQYGNHWQGNGNGTYTSVTVPKYYSPLDLYLMGMIDKSQVPPMLLIDNPAVDPSKMPETGATITGTTRFVTIEDIIAAEGERIPDANAAPKQFKVAFIFVTNPDTFNEQELYAIENIRNGFLTRYSILTDGKGIIQVTSSPKEDLPLNPGVRPPAAMPRTLPPNVNDGVNWLISHQQTDGSWTDFALTTERDTAETVTTLQRFAVARQQFEAGLGWLNTNASANTDFLARRLEATVQTGGEAGSLISELLGRRNPDGGWGSGRNFLSNPIDTALALKALSRAGYADQAALEKAISWLSSIQNGDGGWSGSDTVSMIQPTATVLTAFNSYRKSFSLEGSIGRAVSFLSGKQNPDGGFGNSPSTTYDSALAVMALQEAGADKETVNRGVAYLSGLQTEDGSWQESPYQTALSVRAVWLANIDPDLSVSAEDVGFIPDVVTTLPTTAVVTAVIKNLGGSDVPQAKVALYEGAVAPEKKVAEQTVALPGQSAVTVTFAIPVTDGKGHTFYVVADPDNTVKESDENNNSAVKALHPRPTHDFQVSGSEVTVTPNPVDHGQQVRIDARVANKGTSDAFNVPVRFFIDDPSGAIDIATINVDVPAGGSITHEVSWQAMKVGSNLPVTVVVDSADIYVENDENNNRGVTNLTVNPVVLTDANLSVSYKDIAINPNPVTETGSVTISAVVKNDGYADAADVRVDFYKGVPGVDGVLLGSANPSLLRRDESSIVSVPWVDIMEAGEKVIYVKVDPGNAIREISETDNAAFTKLTIESIADLAVDASSISFTPHAPKEGEPVTIVVAVHNKGDLPASNIMVRASDGGVLIGTQVVSEISGHSQGLVSFNLDTAGKVGNRQISVSVEGNSTPSERILINNSAASTLVVYKTDLMLSEPFFSPNGDGVKDSTRFSFRHETPQTVTVTIINKKDEVVRTFSGAEFVNTTGGSVVWDGLDASGKVVADGPYRMMLKAVDGTLLNEVTVVVDNDRTSLVESMWEGSINLNDLTCKMDSSTFSSSTSTSMYTDFINSQQWLSDGSGAAYYLSYTPYSTYYEPEVDRPGLYKVSVDGKIIEKLITTEWLVRSNRTITSFAPSPDGSQIALTTSVHAKYLYSSLQPYKDEVWVLNSDGSNLRLLDTVVSEPDGISKNRTKIIINTSIVGPKGIAWSPDNQTIAYTVVSWNGSSGVPPDIYGTLPKTKSLIGVNTDTGEKKALVTVANAYFRNEWDFQWAPAGDSIIASGLRCRSASPSQSYGYCYTYSFEVYVANTGGVSKVIKDFQYDPKVSWLDGGRLVALLGYSGPIGVVDAATGNVIRSEPGTYYVMSPDRRSILVKSTQWMLYDPDLTNIKSVGECSTIGYSPDGSKITCGSDSQKSLHVYSNNTTEKTTFLLDTFQYSYRYRWTYGNERILVSGYQGSDYVLYILDVPTGEKRIVTNATLFTDSPSPLPTQAVYKNTQLVSKKGVDETTNCTPKYGYKDFSLWSVTSNSNLSANLVPVRQNSQFLLRGSATDLNFEGYRIEYADVTEPGVWYPVIPFADAPVSNSNFGTWIPPEHGSYLLRLTVWDKAGNVATDQKKVSWGSYSSITDVYKSEESFSPNGDGIKETVTLHYRVLEPLHVVVTIFDQYNSAVRTFTKDYATPAVDAIVWDGRDDSGRIVPDGTYRFRISDYDFFVQVDTTAPETTLSLSAIERSSIDGLFAVNLKGRAVENNIKGWLLEYGEGENPQEWLTYKNELGILAAHSYLNGYQVIYPIQDAVIQTFAPRQLNWLTGKKFRITAEDFGGRKSSAVTGFVEEKIGIFSWDEKAVPGDIVPGESSKPGIHQIEAFQTIREPLISMVLQYSNSGIWYNAQSQMLPSKGGVTASWDNSRLDLQRYQVRYRAVDSLGREFYSNTLQVAAAENKDFRIYSLCTEDSSRNILYGINPYSTLTKLTFQIKSSQDARYTDWTNFSVKEASAGSSLPEGQIPLNPDINSGMLYLVRMIGVTANGASYTSNEATFPSACAVEITLEAEAAESDCGKTPGTYSLKAQVQKLRSGTKTQSLAYYIQTPAGLQMLRNFDLSTEQMGSTTLDTSALAEGNHQVKAVLTFIDPSDGITKATESAAIVVVDRVMPISSITYPGSSVQLCATQMQGSSGSWFGIPVEAMASDDTRVKGFELFYGMGSNPSFWWPAKTRVGGTASDLMGKSAVMGEMGILDVTEMRNADVSLKLRVSDIAGNSTCTTTTFHIRPLPEIRNLAGITIISPNGDGVSDKVTASYTVDGSATIESKVFSLIRNSDGTFALASSPLRTISAARSFPGGGDAVEWDGKDAAGAIVADGMYGIAVTAKDGCGNSTMKWISVEVDKTPPVSVITYPKPGDALPIVVDVKGTVEDLHFSRYLLEVGEGNDPALWQTIAGGGSQVKDGVLGKWNTFDRQGRWTLRLTSEDASGNKRIALLGVDLIARQTVLKGIDAIPRVVSPNNDGKGETSVLSYEITGVGQVRVEVVDGSGIVVRDYSTTVASAGTYSYSWDGKNSAGGIVKDGIYQIRVTGNLAVNPAELQIETVSVVVDTTAPRLDISQPVNNIFLNKTQIPIIGTIDESNPASYTVSLTTPSATLILDSGSQARSAYTFGTLSDVPDGSYTLTITAKDSGENSTTISRMFTVDRTVPTVLLSSPGNDVFYGSVKNVISVTGSIAEANLEKYAVRLGSGTSPTVWQELVTGPSVPAFPSLYSWKVGKGDGVPDGIYTLALYAKDKAGTEKDARVKVTIDNTSPNVSISSPTSGSYIKAPFSVSGTMMDTNLDQGTLDLSPGMCLAASRWATVKTYSQSIQSGVLEAWEKLPADGDYCLRISALDKVGAKSVASIDLKVDTQPPAAPVLQARMENKMDAVLEWTAATEPDLAGYNLYRGTQKLNTSVITQTSFRDVALKEGTHYYTVKSLDVAGNESGPSNSTKIVLDLTPPTARIISPINGSRASGQIDIRGVADSTDDFKQYRVYVAAGSNPTQWNLLRQSGVPTSNGVLAQWNSNATPEGIYSIKLETEDTYGNINIQKIMVTVDNTPPQKPEILSATVIGSDVSITWNAVPDSDIAGYLLYKNDRLTNAANVGGTLKGYAIQATTYVDKNVLDGEYSYYLIALDQGGNLSEQSSSKVVTVDARAPHATLTHPTAYVRFSDPLLLKAESPDTDVVSVQFQYKKYADSVWSDLGAPVTAAPFTISFAPATLGLPYGSYHVRPVAKDRAGKVDPSPTYLGVMYDDIVPPAAPTGVKATVAGDTVTLVWDANTEQDLKGYNVFRNYGSSRDKINSTPLKTLTFSHAKLQDGEFNYEVQAVDNSNNESPFTQIVSVKIYTPVLVQAFTPTSSGSTSLEGSSCPPGARVEVVNTTVSGPAPPIMVTANLEGKFSIDSLFLTPGQNKITAKATDSSGNVSKISPEMVITYDEAPSVPTGLVASVQGYNVSLSWNPSAESDLGGYNLYRDGVKLNSPVEIQLTSAFSSGYDYVSYNGGYTWVYFDAPKAIDRNLNTYWASPKGSVTNWVPSYWETSLSAKAILSGIQIDWGVGTDASGKEISYGGKDFEIQALAGNLWITIAKVTGNTSKSTSLEFKPSYLTDRVRIYITATNDPTTTTRQVRISEVRLFKQSLITNAFFQDMNLRDHRYLYSLSAVDRNGFESSRSSEVAAVVGDIIPPAAPEGATATVSGSTVSLAWVLGGENDLSGYNVYRDSGDGWQKINLAIVATASYQDGNVKNGSHRYFVTSVDLAGNESSPSNEVEATVLKTAPPAPSHVTVTLLPEGAALALSWDAVGGSVTSYNIYRGITGGGPYTRIATIPFSSPSYKDSGLSNGLTYYYAVASADASGNENLSGESSGTPHDSVAPEIPVISFPAQYGSRVLTYEPVTDIAGLADPGAIVELFRGGSPVGSVTPVETIDAMKLSLDYSGSYATVAPSGNALAYMSNSSQLVLQDLLGAKKTLASYGYSPVWNSTASMIAYIYRDNISQYRIGTYDLATGSTSQVTTDTNTNENSPSWSEDASKLAFIINKNGYNDLYLKNFGNGALARITNSAYAYNSKIAPDGNWIVYFDSSTLKNVNVNTGSITQIDASPLNNSKLGWSPDSKKIAFISTKNGYQNLYSFDTSTNAVTALTNTTNSKGPHAWSPDGGSIAYIRSENDGTFSLWLADTSGNNKMVQQKLSEIRELKWRRNGELLCVDNYGVLAVFLGKHFIFRGIVLEPGENFFYAKATDLAGNVSDPAKEIHVTFETSKVPDVSISASDIFIYPPFPVPGEDVAVNVLVRNPRNISLQNVEVEIYSWNAAGDLWLLKSETVASLPANYSAELSATLNAGAGIAAQSIIVVVDGRNQIKELREDNNYAAAEFYVTDKEEVVVTASTDGAEYSANGDAVVSVTVGNSGGPKAGTLSVRVEDAYGNILALLGTTTLAVPYGQGPGYTYGWNTGNTLVGSYRVHAVFTANDGTVAESIASFAIKPDLVVEADVATDKQSYGPSENVKIACSIKNGGSNYIIPGISAAIRVVDPGNAVVFSEERTLGNLFPGSATNLSALWNTSAFVPGNYRVIMEAYLEGKVVSSSTATITINPSSRISGFVSVDPAVVSAGGQFTVAFTLSNSGNTDSGGIVKALVVDPDSGAFLQSAEEVVTLAKGGSKTGEFGFSTSTLQIKSYQVYLQYLSAGSRVDVSSARISVQDLRPPVVSTVSPQTGSTYNGAISLSVLASDDGSGLSLVEYQLDGEAWQPLPLADYSSGRYSATWSPTKADSGAHTVSFRATDRANNTSIPVSTTFSFEYTTDYLPPVLWLSTLADGSSTTDQTLNLAGTVWDDTAVQDLQVNGTRVAINSDGSFSYPFLLQTGSNVVTTVATDGANNRSMDVRTIKLQSARLTVTSPADNSKTAQALVRVSGTADAMFTVTVAVGDQVQLAGRDGEVFTADVMLLPGLNTILITATAPDGFTTAAKRTALYDDQKPSLAVTDPSQDIHTNRGSIMIKGTASDPWTSVGVSIAVDGQTLTPPLVNGHFEQPVALLEEKPYAIYVTATNEVGTQVTVQRNVIHDTTPPVLAMDPVASQTNQPALTVSGMREDGLDVSVACATAVVGEVIYPSATTWSVTIFGLQLGENTITAVSSDAAGNKASVPASIVFIERAPAVTVIATPNLIWPPDRKLVPVIIEGEAVPHGSDLQSVSLSVTDEYGVFLYSNLKFGDTVMLEAWRKGDDLDGRVYTITGVATDKAGNTTTKTTIVRVFHDQSK